MNATSYLCLIIGCAGFSLGGRTPLNAPHQEPLVVTLRWTEAWQRNPQVSGRFVPGVMVGDPSASVGSRRLQVHVPPGRGSVLCVRVTSRDGHYQASVVHPLNGRTGPVALQGLRERRIRSYRAGDLALRVELGSSCQDPQRTLLPATWGQLSVRGDILLYANARQYTRAVWNPRGSAQPVEVSCSEIGGTANVSYNRVCRLTDGMVSGRTRLTVERSQDGSISSESFWLEPLQ